MRTLTRPTDDAAEVFTDCISKVRTKALKRELALATPHITAAVTDYVVRAQAATLYQMSSQKTVGGSVTAKQMANVYDARMAKGKAPGRPVYDRLMAAPPHGRCPLCGQRTVSTLDHYLPKSLYPALAVAPVNLVPACADCNKAKRATVPTTPESQTLHPYFDRVDDGHWLHALVVAQSPMAFQFVVRPPNTWALLMKKRVRTHFKMFGLATLYASHAAEELLNIRLQMSTLFIIVGPVGVRSDLAQRAESHEAIQPNSWQSAMYRALSVNSWYCDGGCIS